jgi:hypothetical protein
MWDMGIGRGLVTIDRGLNQATAPGANLIRACSPPPWCVFRAAVPVFKMAPISRFLSVFPLIDPTSTTLARLPNGARRKPV